MSLSRVRTTGLAAAAMLSVNLGSTVHADVATLNPQDLAVANRLSWGVTASVMQRISAIGIENWLQGQLHPAPGDHLPPQALAEINALGMPGYPARNLAQNLASRVNAAKAAQAPANTESAPATIATMASTGPGANMAQSAFTQPLTPQNVRNAYLQEAQRQTQARHLLRDIYSADQLREQMTWFWFNHFNLYGAKGEVRLFLADYEDRALRPNALGNFRNLLEATVRSPAMLQYLDNAQNAAGHINENYAREIMELHTMGVGSGYCQKDVQELARILTGVGVANPGGPEQALQHLPPGAVREGMFAFYPARHDRGDKLFLGHLIKGGGYDEVRQALDLLCAQPATARHISRQLAQFFVADNPSPTLVGHMAARFMDTHGDIAAVLDLLFHSGEFRASLTQPLLKDPQHYVLSAVRMAYDDRIILNTGPINNWLNRLGEPLYGHLTPDGYALERSAWNGPGQIEQRFEIAQAIGSGAAGLFKGDAPSAASQPAFPLLQGALYYSGLNETLRPGTRAGLAQATSPQEWNIFFLASPDFMRR
jgi:uncharacterized protein (DUF1800 family)